MRAIAVHAPKQPLCKSLFFSFFAFYEGILWAKAAEREWLMPLESNFVRKLGESREWELKSGVVTNGPAQRVVSPRQVRPQPTARFTCRAATAARAG